MMCNRVVVTGLGVISPAGLSTEEFWSNILKKISYVTRLPSNSAYDKLPSQVAAIVDPAKFDSSLKANNIQNSRIRTISKSTNFAILAAREAIMDAKLDNCGDHSKHLIGVAVGSGMCDFTDICETKSNFDKSYNRVSPYFIPRILLNMAAGNISMEYEFLGPNHCASTACATGAHAIGDSYRIIRDGSAIAMVCGGTEACINPLGIAGFCRIRALSTNFNDTPQEASRPFDESRDGFVIGEGAAILVLEEMNHAVQRNAKIYAEILGYGLSGDACSLTAPHPSGRGAILAMNRALTDSKSVSINDVTYVNAHATSTPIGDNIELTAIDRVFQKSTNSVTVSSTKGCHGHLLGAAGAIESVCTILACYHSVIPPTVNLNRCCPHSSKINCNTDVVKWDHVPRRIALKNSFGFGGTNATLCIGEYKL